jgi:hypothetical protein
MIYNGQRIRISIPAVFKLDSEQESLERNHIVLRHNLRTMSRTEARSKKPRARRLRHSQSLARRRQRFSHASVRSTTYRLGSTKSRRRHLSV